MSVACFLCHVFQTLGHIFNSLSSKLQPKKTQESVKIESKDTDTEQPSAARSFVFPSKKKRVSAEKDPFFLVGARCARAFFFLRKFTFQKHQTVSQKIDCHFLRGVHFSKKSGKRSSWKRRLSRIRLFISRGSSAARSGSGLRGEWDGVGVGDVGAVPDGARGRGHAAGGDDGWESAWKLLFFLVVRRVCCLC